MSVRSYTKLAKRKRKSPQQKIQLVNKKRIIFLNLMIVGTKIYKNHLNTIGGCCSNSIILQMHTTIKENIYAIEKKLIPKN